jgi:glutathione reductase (NADPH)
MFNAASILEDCEMADSFGIQDVDKPKLDFSILKKNRDAYVNRLNGIYGNMLNNAGVALIKGWAKFVENKTIDVNGIKYTADHILVATGSHPMKLGFEGEEHTIDSDGFFDLEELPKKAVVLGGGYIAVELGQILHTYGTEVIQIVRSKILAFADDEVVEVLEKNMKIHNYDLRKKLNIDKIEKIADKNLTVYLTDGSTIENVDCVLVAVGRPANTEGLCLENTNIQLGKNGEIIVDEFQNTTVEGVYAIGDVTGKYELTPVAIKAGRILSERLFNNKPHLKMDYSNIPTVIFSHPPIGTIGMTEKEAKEKLGEENVGVYKSDYVNMFYSLMANMEDKQKALIKYVTDKTDNERVIGLHMVGRNSDEMLQGAGIAIRMGATKKDFDNCVAIHPTGSEELVLSDPRYD